MAGNGACVTICALRPARHTRAGVQPGMVMGFELFGEHWPYSQPPGRVPCESTHTDANTVQAGRCCLWVRRKAEDG